MTVHPDMEKWRNLAAKELRNRAVESLSKPTPEGINIKPLYTAEDIKGIN